MKQHVIPGAIAAAVSATVVGGGWLMAPKPQVTHQVTHVAAASKHTWPGFSEAVRAAIVRDLGDHLKGAKVIIVCQDGSCTDLAQDIDDALEDAKAESVLDRPAFPLGYGIGITADPDPIVRGKAHILATALEIRAGLKVPVAEGRKDGYIVLAIGKRPR